MGEMLLNGILYGANGIRELTQSQYDALSNAEKMNGVLYCIKDSGIVEGEQFAPVIYSTEEREIGTWTDGKPLYQKTVTIPISSQTGDITLEIATGINVCNAFGIIKTSGGFEMALPASYSNIFYCGLQHDGNYVRLSIYSTSSWQQYNTLTEAIVTIQYTKTTDNPGSGSWGTDGVPMVHYDGNEKIVGTWINGKTLYEKTISLTLTGNTSSTRVYEYPHNIANVGTMFITECYNDDGIPINAPRPNAGSTYEITVAINSTKDKIYVETGGSDRTTAVLIIVVRYTKTTD